MWFLVLITLVNALANNRTFILEFRWESPLGPINLLDGLLALGVLIALILPRSGPRYVQVSRVHPAMLLGAGLLVLGLLAGSAVLIDCPFELRFALTDIRDFAALPLAMFLGYALTRNPRAGERFVAWWVVAGLGTAVTLIVFFAGQAATQSTLAKNLNQFRTTEYMASYAGIAGAFLVFASSYGMKRTPRVLGIALGGFALLGNAAPLHRSEWLATAAAIVWAFLLIPRHLRQGKLVFGMLGVPAIVVAMAVAVYVVSTDTHGQFYDRIARRLATIVPISEDAPRERAWDTRLPGIRAELGMLMRNPLMGGGMGGPRARYAEGERVAFYHNAWTSAAARSGIFGLMGVVLAIGSLIVVGRRMIKENRDYSSVMVGAMASIVGVHMALLGASTMSFNTLRGALVPGLICGVLLRMRMMQVEAGRSTSPPDPQPHVEDAIGTAPMSDSRPVTGAGI